MAMLVSGNTDAGVALAASALSGGDFRGSLAGNFAIVSSGQIISLDTRYPVSSDLLESQTGQAAEAAQTQAQVSQIQRENMLWMLPAVIVITLLTVGVILIKLLPALKKSKKDIEKE
jgi:hypothetical protein